MEPNLMIGDRLFVSKYTYGYSRHSLPFSPKIFTDRIFESKPKRGDIIVFKTPADNKTDYIKRLIGLPGDTIQIRNGNLYLNDVMIEKNRIKNHVDIFCGEASVKTTFFNEKLPNGKIYTAVYRKDSTMEDTDKYIVPDNHYFFLGDNRDCSKDSRFLGSVGYVHFNNFVGKARMIFFSNDAKKGSFFEFWKWNKSLRFDRFFKRIL